MKRREKHHATDPQVHKAWIYESAKEREQFTKIYNGFSKKSVDNMSIEKSAENLDTAFRSC